jgi:mannose-6-phosphate isomerase-like protein (cupin superfamily)
VLIKVRSEDTNQTMAMIEETVPAKRLVSPHTHQNDAWVYVLTGEIGVLVGDEVPVATAGSWALKPRNVVHAMWNPGIVPARVVEVLTPGELSAGSKRSPLSIPTIAMVSSPPASNTASSSSPESPWIEKLRSMYALL